MQHEFKHLAVFLHCSPTLARMVLPHRNHTPDKDHIWATVQVLLGQNQGPAMGCRPSAIQSQPGHLTGFGSEMYPRPHSIKHEVCWGRGKLFPRTFCLGFSLWFLLTPFLLLRTALLGIVMATLLLGWVQLCISWAVIGYFVKSAFLSTCGSFPLILIQLFC